MSSRSTPRRSATGAFPLNPLCRAIAIGLTSSLASFAAAAAGESGDLEQVVVTGEKTERGLQETVTSVRVVTAENLEEQNINSFYDVLERTPNVSGQADSGFSIRGIDAFNVSGGGNSYLASVYSDGAPLPYRSIREGGFSTWDVARVEVLRGPQSTLQGRNALAGAIVMNTVDPGYEWDFRGRLGMGNEGREEKAVAFGGGLIEDQLAVRLAAEQRDFDGFVKNVTRGENSDFEEDETLRLKMLAEPDALPDLRAMLTLTKAETDYGVEWVNADVEDPFDSPQTDFNDPTHEFTDTDMAVLKLEYDLGAHWKLSSTTAYSDVDYGYEWDGDVSPAPGAVQTSDVVDETLSQELLFNFDYDRVTGVVGAYYSDLDSESDYQGNRLTSLAELGINAAAISEEFGLPEQVSAALLGLYTDFDPALLHSDGFSNHRVKTEALFTDVTFAVNDRLDLFAGLRYDRESQANEGEDNFTIENADELPDPNDPALAQLAPLVGAFNNYLLGFAASASGTEPLVDQDFSEFLPKAGATWNWTEDMSTSFTAQKGYRSGGVGNNVARGYTYVYDPEFTRNYELAFRSLWLDGRLAANANLFYLDWEDQQVSVQLSGGQFDTETVNSGQSTVKGAELELFYRANENWSGYAGVGISETEFDEFLMVRDSGTYDLSGRPFANAPEITANFGVTYRSDLGAMFNINANYRDETQTVLNPYTQQVEETDPRFDPQNDARWLVNMRAGYEWDNVGAFLTVSNLFDEEYVAIADRGEIDMTIGRPRLASLRVEVDF